MAIWAARRAQDQLWICVYPEELAEHIRWLPFVVAVFQQSVKEEANCLTALFGAYGTTCREQDGPLPCTRLLLHDDRFEGHKVTPLSPENVLLRRCVRTVHAHAKLYYHRRAESDGGARRRGSQPEMRHVSAP